MSLAQNVDRIVAVTKITNGGGLTRKLEELQQCGFIRKYEALGFANNLYQLTKQECSKLQKRIASLHEQLPNRSILVTMIASNGLKHNEHSYNMIQNELSLESLFEA